MRTTIIAAALVAFVASGALADSALALLPAQVGQRVHLRITHRLQGLAAPQTATADVLLQRKAADTLLLEWRDRDGNTVDSVLTLGADGALQLAASERDSSTDADVRALLPGLNLALAVVHDATLPDWDASLTVPGVQPKASTTIVVPVHAVNAGPDLELRGIGSTAMSGAEGGQSQGERRRGGFGGFGGGFGGGLGGGLGGLLGGRSASGGTRGESGDQSPPPAASGSGEMTLLVQVDGRVSGGRVDHLAIAQTRAIELDGVPFVNASSWTIDVLGPGAAAPNPRLGGDADAGER